LGFVAKIGTRAEIAFSRRYQATFRETGMSRVEAEVLHSSTGYSVIAPLHTDRECPVRSREEGWQVHHARRQA